jgi:predicted transcriptional regulator with HTH domain
LISSHTRSHRVPREELDDLLIAYRHAFRRSRLRVEIMLALLVFGRQNLADLARLAGGTADNVYGSLWGAGDRYRQDGALVLLGLVEVRVVGDDKVYQLSAVGRRVAEALRAQVEKRRGRHEIVRT